MDKSKKKNKIVGVILWIILAGVAFYMVMVVPQMREMNRVRDMPINHVNLDTLEDGDYYGEFTYGSFTYKIIAKIESHKLYNIEVVSNRTSQYAKKAEDVIQRVIEEQTVAVDTISGATTTSKALLKAIEVGLSSSPTN